MSGRPDTTDPLDRIEALATEVQEWLRGNERGNFNIACQRCNAPFEHEGRPVAAPPEWYGGLDWERDLARDVLALVAVARAARQVNELCREWEKWDARQKEDDCMAPARARSRLVMGLVDPALARLDGAR